MKVQFHHNELRPLIKEGYDKVYDAMSRLMTPEELIFAKWEAGFGGVLQWTLPKEHEWRSFSQGDNYDKQAVVNEFMRIKGIGLQKLGTNEKLKQAVYSIPSEGSIYYTITPDGKYHVMLTAWGYSFPTQAPITDITWVLPAGSQDTTARFIENGNPMVNLPIKIHRKVVVLNHTLDENGEKYFGKLVPGDELLIEVPSHNKMLTLKVVPGQMVYTFDLTIAQQPYHHTPTIPTPTIPTVPQTPDNEPEEIVVDRTVKIQLVGCDGKPIGNRAVNIMQRGNAGVGKLTDASGCIYLCNNDLAAGSTLKIQIKDAAQQPQYSDFEMVVEDKEDDYVIVYHEKKRSWWWLYLLLFLVAVALAYVVIELAANTPIHF